jgi:hypothetical protein
MAGLHLATEAGTSDSKAEEPVQSGTGAPLGKKANPGCPAIIRISGQIAHIRLLIETQGTKGNDHEKTGPGQLVHTGISHQLR